MSLSKISTTPTYVLTLPSSGKKIKYRPYGVGEQKDLLIVKMEENNASIMATIESLVNQCTFGQIDFKNAATFDIEYILLNLRAKSSGEIINVGRRCTATKDCQGILEFQINLNQWMSQKHAKIDRNVKIGDDLYLVMSLPMYDDETLQESNIEIDEDDEAALLQATFKKIARSIECVISGEEVIDVRQESFEEVLNFVNRLTADQLTKIKEYFDGLPKIRYSKKHVCPVCSKENEVAIEGLLNFFI